jgi:three-Cys-motif partner protein
VVAKPYTWADGAQLDEHSRRKHKILREYFHQYLMVRCQNPAQTKFRLAVVDGFSGAGRYTCGSAGSPIIFIEELQRAVDAVNLRRASRGLNASVEVECLLIFNDALPDVTEMLKSFAAPVLVAAKETCPKLHLSVCYLSELFENSYPAIKEMIARGRYRNVLFNLDQCGHSKVEAATLVDIMASTPSAEIFYTFAIQTLLTYLSRTNVKLMAAQVRPLGIDPSEFRVIDGVVTNSAWLGAAERIVFETFKGVARFVSPFSITNPEGWRYWLIHFANNYRARQVYNDVLHGNGTQAHFGRSGLNMLSYDPSHAEGSLYLFEGDDRSRAKDQLLEDIPRLIAESGDAMNVAEFYEAAYNVTPAHKDDIHAAMFDSVELEIFTDAGGRRRKANTISVTDTIKLKSQRSFFSIFFDPDRAVAPAKLIK